MQSYCKRLVPGKQTCLLVTKTRGVRDCFPVLIRMRPTQMPLVRMAAFPSERTETRAQNPASTACTGKRGISCFVIGDHLPQPRPCLLVPPCIRVARRSVVSPDADDVRLPSRAAGRRSRRTGRCKSSLLWIKVARPAGRGWGLDIQAGPLPRVAGQSSIMRRACGNRH